MGRSWTVGDVSITEIAELTSTSAAHWLLPDATADRVREIGWVVPHYATVEGKVHMFDGNWVPTFPNARYLFADVEWEHWQRDDSGMDHELRADSIQPVVDAGLVDLVATDATLTAHVSLVPTPGHTPGHVSVLIESVGERAMITGDLSHMVCQAAHPEWGSSFDVDPSGAEATRRAFFAERADTDVLVLGTHWEPCAGYVRSDGDVWRIEPADRVSPGRVR